MSLLNSAKKFALKNKDKVAAGVEKATDTIDKKTGGKHTDKLRKLDQAAAKFAGKPAATADTATETATDTATETAAVPEASKPVASEPPMPDPG